MRAIRDLMMAIIVAAILVIPVGISALQEQQASAIIIVNTKEFKKLTHEFEKAVIGGQWDPGDGRELLLAYSDGVMSLIPTLPVDFRITVEGLLEEYEQGVLSILEQPPPDDGKPHELIKDFRELTHDFIKDVVDAASAPPPDDG